VRQGNVLQSDGGYPPHLDLYSQLSESKQEKNKEKKMIFGYAGVDVRA